MLGKKLKRVIAIIALIHILVFTVTLPLYLGKHDMWDGRVGIIALYTGIMGVLFFFVIWLDNKNIARKKNFDEMQAAAREDYEKNKEKKSADETSTDSSDASSDSPASSQSPKDSKDRKSNKNELDKNDLI